MKTFSFEHWPELDALFERALELPQDEVQAFLSAIDDVELRREVGSLLEDERASRGVFGDQDSLPWGPATQEDGVRGLQVGDRVGAYRILDTLGRGGSSTVYLAERVDGAFVHRVALKVLDPSLMARSARDRFHQERQILARLEHSNIARLLDGGITSDGWPYITIELVVGEPIDRYCDRLKLSLEERLKLFTKVCDAVHHAHVNLVVHRDLKPSNILVTADGQVKLLDFGIAKILDQDGFSGSVLETRTGVYPMTPAYAAPEQLQGDTVTTATDVFQLGAVLYHLLTGRRASDPTWGSEAIRRGIAREAPDLPSRTVVRGTGEGGGPGPDSVTASPAALAALRGVSVRALVGRLKGDVDTIVVTAMRTDPARRYSSAGDMARDIQRHLDGRPVQAHPDSLLYRASKFAVRHPVGVVATVLAGLTVSILSVGLLRQYETTRQEREKAGIVTAFLVDLFARADPSRSASDTLTARALLEEGADRARKELVGQPLVQAAVMDAIGRAFMGLGRGDEAADLLTTALDIRRRELDGVDPDLGSSLYAMGALRLEQRDFEGSEEYHREALSFERRARGRDSREVAMNLGGIGLALHSQGRVDEARSFYEEALRIYRTHDIPFDQSATEILVNLGWLHDRAGRAPEAEALFREALLLRRALHGESHPAVVGALTALAGVERRSGRLDSALVHTGSAIEITERVFGSKSSRFGDALLVRAGTRLAAGRIGEAEEDYRRALVVIEASLGSTSPDAARILNDLGNLLRDRGDLPEAEAMARRAVNAYEESMGRDHLFTGIAFHNLGRTLAARGSFAEAEESLSESLRVLGTNGLGDDPRSARVLTDLGSVKVEIGEPEAAESILRRSLVIWEGADRPEPIQLASTRAFLGRSLLGQQRLEEAEPLLLSAYEAMRAIGTDRHPATRRVAGWVAELYERSGRSAEADRFRNLASDQSG